MCTNIGFCTPCYEWKISATSNLSINLCDIQKHNKINHKRTTTFVSETLLQLHGMSPLFSLVFISSSLCDNISKGTARLKKKKKTTYFTLKHEDNFYSLFVDYLEKRMDAEYIKWLDSSLFLAHIIWQGSAGMNCLMFYFSSILLSKYI